MVALSIIVTIIAGVFGAYLGALIEFSNLGIIVAIAVMGGFILSGIRKRSGNKD
jgi:ABC-type Mn2+/Zn2+ transport system permease subunit